MNSGSVFELDLIGITTGGADDQARRLLEVWNNNGGFLTGEIASFTSQLLLFDGTFINSDGPRMLWVGENSLAARILGSEWAGKPNHAVKNLDDEYVDLISKGYKDAIAEHRPVFQYVSTELERAGEKITNVRYQRLVLPFRNLNGQHYLFCYSHDAGTSRPLRDPRPDEKHLLLTDPQNMGHAKPGSMGAFSK